MNITHYESREAAIGWAHEISELLGQRFELAAVRGVESAIEQFVAARFQLAVLGKAKRGKSTLINALLGRRDDSLAPIDRLPASAAITRFSWSELERVVVHFQDGHQEGIPVGRIREYVTEEFNPDNRKSVDVLDVSGPFAGFDRDLVLIDTPGAGSIHAHHDALVHAFIPQADAVLFLVTARMPIDQDELELLAQLKAAEITKVFFAINRIDELSRADLDDAVGHNRSLLSQAGIRVDRLHEISAKRAFEGDISGSGLASLTEEIGAFLAASKGNVLRERYVHRIEAQVTPILRGLDVELAYAHKSSEELEVDLRKLHDRRRTIESERELVEREFTRTWTTGVDQLEQELSTARRRISADFGNRIAGTPVLDITALARRIPTLLNQAIDEQLSRPVHSFEQAARAACTRLQANYPEISVGETGTIAVRTQADPSFLAGSAGGLAAAAVGAGLAAAGGTAAAGIATANAAALAMTTTVAAPSVLSSLLGLAGLEVLAPLATGTATIAAPAALTTTPLWVALAGPVGWTLAGVGLLAVPFSWRLAKLKLRDKLEQASQDQIRLVFDGLTTERVPSLRRMGKTIVEEFRTRLDRELQQIESAIVQARDRRPNDIETARSSELAQSLRSLLNSPPVPRPNSSTR